MRAAYDLVRSFNPKAVFINFIIELRIEGLDGRAMMPPGTNIDTLLTLTD